MCTAHPSTSRCRQCILVADEETQAGPLGHCSERAPAWFAMRSARKPVNQKGSGRHTERDRVAVLDDQRLDAVVEAHLYCGLRHILYHVGACGVGVIT